MEENSQIYEKIRNLRRSRGITVDELAKELGENSQKVGRIERGKRSLTVDYLMKISRALSTPVHNLLTEEESRPSPSSNCLNEIVILVEEISPLLPISCSSQQKANLISKIYELISKLPPESQASFIHPLRESLKLFLEIGSSSCN